MTSETMLNQVAVEASYSATYVENYLDCVENLPDDLQRHLTRIRELDVSYVACLRDVEAHVGACLGEAEVGAGRRARAQARVHRALVAAKELGDEKLQVVQKLQDQIDARSRHLEQDFKKLESILDQGVNGAVKEEVAPVEAPPIKEVVSPVALSVSANVPSSVANQTINNNAAATPPHTLDRDKDKSDRDKTGERASKRPRRTRTDTTSGGDSGGADREPAPPERTSHTQNSSTQQKKAGMGKKKKRKSRTTAAQSHREETPPLEDPDPIDPDEPTYCLCDQISFGEMILCDNDLCPIEWFHFSCVSLTTKPKGKWFCPKCRGDRPNVMKPKGQFLKELERYNKEKEEKA